MKNIRHTTLTKLCYFMGVMGFNMIPATGVMAKARTKAAALQAKAKETMNQVAPSGVKKAVTGMAATVLNKATAAATGMTAPKTAEAKGPVKKGATQVPADKPAQKPAQVPADKQAQKTKEVKGPAVVVEPISEELSRGAAPVEEQTILVVEQPPVVEGEQSVAAETTAPPAPVA
jgi:hypothetical protein